jgi:hypothetical protein
MHKIPLVLAIKRDALDKAKNRRSIRLEFTAPRNGPNHDGVRYTMWMTPAQVEQWEKENHRGLNVGTRFDLSLELAQETAM